MVKGGSLSNLSSQRRLVKRSKSCMVRRGTIEKSFREVKTVIFLIPWMVSIMVRWSGRSHSSLGSLTMNFVVGSSFFSSGSILSGRESCFRSILPNIQICDWGIG